MLSLRPRRGLHPSRAGRDSALRGANPDAGPRAVIQGPPWRAGSGEPDRSLRNEARRAAVGNCPPFPLTRRLPQADHVTARPDLVLDLLAFGLSGENGFDRVFGIRPETGRNTPSVTDGLDADPRLSDPAQRGSGWLDDDKRLAAFRAFTEKGKKHRSATITAGIAPTLPFHNAECRYPVQHPPLIVAGLAAGPWKEVPQPPELCLRLKPVYGSWP